MIIKLLGVSKMKLSKIMAYSQESYADTYLSNVIGVILYMHHLKYLSFCVRNMNNSLS